MKANKGYRIAQYEQCLPEGATIEEVRYHAKSGMKVNYVIGTVNAATKEVEPKITSDYLKDNITELSHFSTYSTNNSNGNENMRISLAACNGSIINPGETWSFNDCTGNSNLESLGYQSAHVIEDGKKLRVCKKCGKSFE